MESVPALPPVRLVVTDDLRRSRATVFFRLLLVIPAWIVFAFWSIAAFVVAIAAWFVILVRGRCSDGIHEFLATYLRYSVQVSAYMHLSADPYPGFGTKPDYPVRVEVDGPAEQRRWTVFFRIFLVLPAIALAATTGGSVNLGLPRGSGAYSYGVDGSGTGFIAAVLGWFASVAQARMPRGLRDLTVYGIGYSAQTSAYLFLLTDRYPSSDPALAGPMALPDHPVDLEFKDDLSRPRLLVLFRLLLALPHLVWLTLWSILAVLAALVGWLVAPFPGRLPRPLHRFLAAFVRYATHVSAFLYSIGGPFPGFVGAEGSYPVDVRIAPPEQQGRWGLVFRGFLLVPALLLSVGYSSITFAVGVLGWFSSLARGRMPEGMTKLGAVSLRYQAQMWAYGLLLTARYPYSAPALKDGTAAEPEPEPDVYTETPAPEPLPNPPEAV